MTDLQRAIEFYEHMACCMSTKVIRFERTRHESQETEVTRHWAMGLHTAYMLALEALREKQERQKGCDMCGAGKRLMVDVFADNMPERLLTVWENYKPIFCPMCGRQLATKDRENRLR